MIKMTPVEHLGLLVASSYAFIYCISYVLAELLFRISIKKEDRL
jgi:hypothetical protein